MKFPNVIGKRDLIHAAIIGSVSGLAGVLFFILLLSSMDPKEQQQVSNQPEEEVIPVQSTEEPIVDKTAVEFFANQHGVFSSHKSALDFIAGYASLNTSAIVEIDGNFYVWSTVTPVKEELVITDDPTSFAKSFTLSASTCSNPALQSLPTHLQSNNPSKFYFEDTKNLDNKPTDWDSITSALSSISGDLSVVRLHLIAHYFNENDCMKIKL
ncbi:hypothetical protein SAMN05880501_10366 [Ureibacillus xyleni]|uniref:Uncharacterized protein n=1 Tax=Ureibacillus xyleni TaxID=614648 RepID=A0A285SAY2_9BACL|nr:hypothetical protein [Ureibacillus xyleni]SOC02576.1 hypothetical protein SAMN05880501_10366 [Ureibacillus xyleni]